MAAEQLTIPGSIQIEPDRRCQWNWIEFLTCDQDNPMECRLIADVGSVYCQKHRLLLKYNGMGE